MVPHGPPLTKPISECFPLQDYLIEKRYEAHHGNFEGDAMNITKIAT